MLADVRLPPQLLRGRVLRVRSINCLEIRLTLAFGVSVEKNVVLEGVDKNCVPEKRRQAAKRALIVLVGGKDVIVHTDTLAQDGFVIGRVYLDEKIYGKPEVGFVEPYNIDVPMLEVSTFYLWLRERDFDVRLATEALNGSKNTKTKRD